MSKFPCQWLVCAISSQLLPSTELLLIFLIPVFLLAHCYFLSCYFFSYLPTVSFSLLLLSYCYPDWINGTITYFPNTCILTCPLLLSFLLLFSPPCPVFLFFLSLYPYCYPNELLPFFLFLFFPLAHCYFLSCYFFSYLSTVTFFPVTFFPVTFFPTWNCYFLSCYLFSCYFLSVHHISHRTTTSEMIKEGCHPSSWRHSMETLSISLALCNGNSLAFDGPLAVMSSLCLFVAVSLNNLLNKQSRDQWNDGSWRPYGGIFYDAAMISKRFVMGIHRSVVDYHRKEPIMRSFGSLCC